MQRVATLDRSRKPTCIVTQETPTIGTQSDVKWMSWWQLRLLVTEIRSRPQTDLQLKLNSAWGLRKPIRQATGTSRNVLFLRLFSYSRPRARVCVVFPLIICHPGIWSLLRSINRILERPLEQQQVGDCLLFVHVHLIYDQAKPRRVWGSQHLQSQSEEHRCSGRKWEYSIVSRMWTLATACWYQQF